MKVASVLALGGILVACFNAGNQAKRNMDDLRTRAGFDLSCKDLEITALHRNLQYPEIVTTAGITGCGKKATYLLTNTHGWVQNTDATPAKK